MKTIKHSIFVFVEETNVKGGGICIEGLPFRTEEHEKLEVTPIITKIMRDGETRINLKDDRVTYYPPSAIKKIVIYTS